MLVGVVDERLRRRVALDDLVPDRRAGALGAVSNLLEGESG
jgi:hypothetical protein